jgi:hypothetical protein
MGRYADLAAHVATVRQHLARQERSDRNEKGKTETGVTARGGGAVAFLTLALYAVLTPVTLPWRRAGARPVNLLEVGGGRR